MQQINKLAMIGNDVESVPRFKKKHHLRYRPSIKSYLLPGIFICALLCEYFLSCYGCSLIELFQLSLIGGAAKPISTASMIWWRANKYNESTAYFKLYRCVRIDLFMLMALSTEKPNCRTNTRIRDFEQLTIVSMDIFMWLFRNVCLVYGEQLIISQTTLSCRYL